MQANGEIFLKPGEVQKLLRISRGGFYLMAKRGDIPTVKLGKLLLVPRQFVDGLLKKCEV